MSMVTNAVEFTKRTKPNELQLKPDGTRGNTSNEQLVTLIRAGEDEADNMLSLWQQNKGFIYKMAMKYRGYAEMDDLKQEGYLGLCEAVRQYDPEQGVTFLHYATFWIRQYMQRYIDNCCQPIRIPVHAQDAVRRYKKAVREYRQYYVREPSESALCAILDVGQENLHIIQKNARIGQIRSLDEPLSDEVDSFLVDVVSDDHDMEEDVIKRMDAAVMKEELWIAVDQLPDNLPGVLKKRYLDQMTLKEIGESMGVSASKARDMEHKAMRLLRLPNRCGRFRGYYEEYLEAGPILHVGVENFNRTWTSSVERKVLGW